MVATRPLHPLFVAEIDGVEVRTASAPEVLDAIRAALDRFAVVVFRDQHLDDDEHVAFARRLGGDLVTKVGRTVVDGAKRLTTHGITDISNLDEDGAPMERADRRRMYSLGNRLWHTDASFQHPPARYSMLSAKAVPAERGETQWADTRAAYDALPEHRKAEIAGLRAFHSIVYSRSTIGFTDFAPGEAEQFPGAEQPLVRRHPGSGRDALYVAAHAERIVGWPVPDGRLLLRDLLEHATRPEFVYTHPWRVGDFVIWDNRSTVHRGLPFDETTQRRVLRRATTLDGE